MYISSCSIRSWNWNRKLTQDHFLIEHCIQRTHRCPAVRCWPWVYSLGIVSRYSTVRSGTLTWREWGLWYVLTVLLLSRGYPWLSIVYLVIANPHSHSLTVLLSHSCSLTVLLSPLQARGNVECGKTLPVASPWTRSTTWPCWRTSAAGWLRTLCVCRTPSTWARWSAPSRNTSSSAGAEPRSTAVPGKPFWMCTHKHLCRSHMEIGVVLMWSNVMVPRIGKCLWFKMTHVTPLTLSQ